jgi:hypothetical protein
VFSRDFSHALLDEPAVAPETHRSDFFDGLLAGLPLGFLAVDRFIHFAAMHRDCRGGLDAKSHPAALDTQHCNDNVVIDEDAFVLLPG